MGSACLGSSSSYHKLTYLPAATPCCTLCSHGGSCLHPLLTCQPQLLAAPHAHIPACCMCCAAVQVQAGHASLVDVEVDLTTGWVTIRDNGRGIPTDVHPKTGG